MTEEDMKLFELAALAAWRAHVTHSGKERALEAIRRDIEILPKILSIIEAEPEPEGAGRGLRAIIDFNYRNQGHPEGLAALLKGRP